MTYRTHSLGWLASLCALPLLAACPGTVGDLGDHGEDGPGESSGEEGSASGGSGGSGGTSASSSEGSDTSLDTGPDDACTDEECGPAPGAPNFLCQDGVTWGGPGPCERGEDGTCGWTFVECPACCYVAEEPPCIEGSVCCADGTWACNDPGGPPPCEAGTVCACCDAAEEPPCIEGATCCGGGVWACNDDGGNPSCGDIGVVCDLPPTEECCDAAEEPPCIEGSMCCADGSWACVDPGGPPPCEVPGDVCPDGVCQEEGESCAAGEGCCAGLECCEGVPVPPGSEFCSSMCPISDRNRKENFEAIDAQAILHKLLLMPITTWNYTFEDPRIRHLGPMAQDFKTAFEVGATDRMIFQIDADGVALASIQAMYGELSELREDKAALEKTVEELEARLARLEAAAR
ncbi:MAG: tail fiber domain-containing protein [Myxococcales bacterium]|nr:tail fiber domain-containing protein [Myxococcales bacterium]